MENIRPALRWIAIAGAIALLAFVFFAPHRSDVTSVDIAPTPPQAVESPAVATPAPVSSPSDVAVYVCGAVRRPAVYRLPAGSRVVDAVDRAGGLSNDADAEAINLASPLTDGMKVDVPKKGAHPVEDPVSLDGMNAAANPRAAHHRSSGRSSHKLAPGQTLDINTAGASDLVQLPGVGPSLARRIVEYRQANGPFATLDDLQNVSGIGPSKFAKMEPYLTL